MGNVKYIDNSLRVKAEINETTLAWLHEWALETASQAQRNCRMGEEYSNQLKGSYHPSVDERKGEAKIGSAMEQAFWEEFGTGEHADTGKNGGKPGRKDWWLYIKGESGGTGKESRHYATREEAEDMAAYIKKRYGKTAIVTNGKEPNYTLEKAFISVKLRAEADLKAKLKELKGK